MTLQYMDSNSDFEGGVEVTSIESYGMHFCPTCKNLMSPSSFSANVLDFSCDKCKKKIPVDYTNRESEQSLLYSKQLQAGSKKFISDLAYIFDPTMPSVKVQCQKCGYERAVYMLTPDEGQTKLVARMICANATGTVAKCGHTWILEEESQLSQTKVISQQQKFFENI